ncbi:CrcB family protein [Luteimonas sp. RD2P54]|uniref:Fluoride-specific ion channel FluC n=1 Tax=Luteimonas endophytica TaxID=3042023 RepID=A0ABT6J7B5_9GAMM|nr:CrcB family protein [Luteimonas endophytica]MDH5822720.1 CrcB family protein [Luteimonas endophytica]
MTEPWWAQLACVMLGGALGGALRHGVASWIARRAGGPMPWGTLAVNASGAFAAGLLLGWLPGDPGQARALWLALGVGLLGSYTTVSALSLQTLMLAQAGRGRQAAGYVLLSLAAGIAAAGCGYALAAG